MFQKCPNAAYVKKNNIDLFEVHVHVSYFQIHVSPRTFAELKTLGEMTDFYFCPWRDILLKECTAAEREKGAFFLSWSIYILIDYLL